MSTLPHMPQQPSQKTIDFDALALEFNQEEFAANMAIFVEEYGKAMKAFIEPHLPNEEGEQPPVMSLWTDETTTYIATISKLTEQLMKEPAPAIEASIDLWKTYVDVWFGTLRDLTTVAGTPTTNIPSKDGRFKDEEWHKNPIYHGLREAYAATTQWADSLVEKVGLDTHTKNKANFYIKQIMSSLSPSNSVWTNPELLRETMNSNGQNLVRGIKMLEEDIRAGGGKLRIRQSDLNTFTIGKNIATTKGKVIFRNNLFELIHYVPHTPAVYTQPILIIPPWINKYYILDLTPEKSYINWCLDQGLNVFCISWVNPDENHKYVTFADYITSGLFEAIDVMRTVTGQPKVHAVGYCVGGTMLSTALAVMAQKNDARIASATLLTTQVDFTNSGDLNVFIDKKQLDALEAFVMKQGYLDGQYMSSVFNMLKPHDLIWPYFVNTYLKGTVPTPFDMLYWNSDPTRQAASNHIYYLRKFYLENKFAKDALEILGVTPKISDIKIPIFSLATKDDHIAPALSVFNGVKLFKGPIEFVLAGSGHIAGVVNPPARKKYQYWTGTKAEDAISLEDWQKSATTHEGSWWPYWLEWLKKQSVALTLAPVVGIHPKFPALCDAPGTYVLVREDDSRISSYKEDISRDSPHE